MGFSKSHERAVFPSLNDPFCSNIFLFKKLFRKSCWNPSYHAFYDFLFRFADCEKYQQFIIYFIFSMLFFGRRGESLEVFRELCQGKNLTLNGPIQSTPYFLNFLNCKKICWYSFSLTTNQWPSILPVS